LNRWPRGHHHRREHNQGGEPQHSHSQILLCCVSRSATSAALRRGHAQVGARDDMSHLVSVR
jgi:hypothetical protein